MVYYSTVPFCYHLVQKPAFEVSVQVEVEAILNFAEFTVSKIKARMIKYAALFIVLKNI